MTTPILRCRDLAASYGARPVFTSASLALPAGIYALRGPNGLGKSTFLRLLAGAQVPDSGEVWIDGLSLMTSPRAARRRLSFVPDDSPVYPFMTGRELLHFVALAKHAALGAEVLRLVEGFDLRPQLDMRFDTMSLGTQKKLLLCAAWIGAPRVILMDEPSNGLDCTSRDLLVMLLRSPHERCVLFATHDADTVAATGATTIELEKWAMPHQIRVRGDFRGPNRGRRIVSKPTTSNLLAMDIAPAPALGPALRIARFDNSYARLPERFFARLDPTPVPAPRVVRLNRALAATIGVDADALSAEVLAGDVVPAGAEPIALAYAGHQFGNFVPQLGDGRAILLGEVVGPDGIRRDIQLKGSGPTPFSRRGDGRAVLGPVLREYIVSEAMAALGVPTTRALAAVTTGERVMRETVLPGAVLTRVAASHLRVGTFQYFAARRDVDGLRILADYAIARHYPDAAETAQPYRAFFTAVVARQAALVARWMLIGFVHGVLNTDNTSISGETLDYGPCAFMDHYDTATVFSSIDHGGRYAYGNQPAIMQWNLARLAEALMPLLGETQDDALAAARAALTEFGSLFEAAYRDGLVRKIGLSTTREGDVALAEDLLQRMAANAADFTLTFRRLAHAAHDPEQDASVRALFTDGTSFDGWSANWRQRLAEEPGTPAARMLDVNPAVIPRNHLVEEALQAAVTAADYAPFETLLESLAHPFTERPPGDRSTLPPLPEQRVLQTFCGT